MAGNTYNKIVVGEAIEEQSPFLADSSLAPTALAIGGRDGDIPIGSAVPVYSQDYYMRAPARSPGTGVYGTYPHQTLPHTGLEIYGEPGEDCAQIGCFFSWIPLVGFVTCFLHADAPPNSRREYWAYRSCVVSSLVTGILLIFLFTYYNTTSVGGKHSGHLRS